MKLSRRLAYGGVDLANIVFDFLVITPVIIVSLIYVSLNNAIMVKKSSSKRLVYSVIGFFNS